MNKVFEGYRELFFKANFYEKQAITREDYEKSESKGLIEGKF